MRPKCFSAVLFIIGVLLLYPLQLVGQPGGGAQGGQGGGVGKKGRGGQSPDDLFNFYSKGEATIDFSKMDANQRVFAKQMIGRLGFQVDDNSVITREQFLSTYNPQAGKGGFNAKGGGGPGGMGAGGPGGMGAGGPGGMGAGGPGGRGQMTEQDVEQRFRGMDRNQDGKLTFDEVDDRTKGRFGEMDANSDGGVDMNEYKTFVAAMMARGNGRGQMGPGGGPGGPGMNFQMDPNSSWSNNNQGWGNDQMWGQGPNGPGNRREKPPEEVAVRFGKLPQGLPDWFTELDTDRDGNVGLYEWRAGNKTMSEFRDWDLDRDGLISPLEALRYQAQKTQEDHFAALSDGEEQNPRSGGAAGGRPGGGFGRPGGGTGGDSAKGANGGPPNRGAWGAAGQSDAQQEKGGKGDRGGKKGGKKGGN